MNKLLVGLIVLLCFSSMAFGQQDRVGIGTTAPDVLLHVFQGSAGTVSALQSSIAAFEASNDGYLSILTPDNKAKGILFGGPSMNFGGGIIYNSSQTLNGLQFRTNTNSTRMVIDSEGRVGISTLAPSYLLDLGYSTTNKKLALYGDPNNFYGFGITSNKLEFHAASTQNEASQMILTGAGNLGIGSHSPLARLHITGDQPGLILESTNPLDASGGKEAISRITFRGQKNNVYRDAAIIEARQNATWSAGNPFFSPTALHFYTQNNGANGDELDEAKMVLTSGGALSVGHNAPQAAFHVKNSAGPGQHIALIENENADGSGLKIKINGNHGMWIPTGETTGFFPLKLPDPDALFIEPIITEIKNRIMSNKPFEPVGMFDFINLFTEPVTQDASNLIDSLHLDELLRTGICEGQDALLEFLGLGDLDLNTITNALPTDISSLPIISDAPIDLPNFSNANFQIPTGLVTVGGSLINYCLRDPFDNSICWDIDPLKPGIQALVDPLKLQVVTTSYSLQDLSDLNIPAFGSIKNAFNTLGMELPKVLDGINAVKGQLGNLKAPEFLNSVLNCPTASSPEEFLLSLPMIDPTEVLNGLDQNNHFVTFVDKGDRELGAIKAQNLQEWTESQVSTSNLLELAGILPGLIQLDGGAIENLIAMVDFGYGWVQSYNSIGVTYESNFGDYAEWLPRRNPNEKISYGDIVGIRSGYISKDLTDAEQVMVVSKAPIIMGNAPHPDSVAYGNNVAFIGQVPVKVMGPVHSGDYMVADLEESGFAKAIAPKNMTAEDFRYTVGRSWDTNTTPGFKFVNTLVGMHNNAWVAPLQNTQSKVSELEAELHHLRAKQAQQDQVLYQLVERVNGMSAEARPATSFSQTANK